MSLLQRKIIHKYSDDSGDPVYYIAWDKTDDHLLVWFYVGQSSLLFDRARNTNTAQVTLKPSSGVESS